MMKIICKGIILGTLLSLKVFAMEKIEVEVLSLDVIPYEEFMRDDPHAKSVLKRALYEKGIVGIKGIPGYKEKTLKFIEMAREFSALPEEVKERYTPNRSLNLFPFGYEKGKEKFQRPDGTWVIDDLKVSYWGAVPDNSLNTWPVEIDVKNPFQDLGTLMSTMGIAILEKIGLASPEFGIRLDGLTFLGRMLYYCNNSEGPSENPYWCGSHFDHGLFTALLPAFYFSDGKQVDEPTEAGLFIKTTSEGIFKKVVANDPEILLFQVGEFAQLATDDGIRATEHRVHKANGPIERHTLALFFDAPLDTVIHSSSKLTSDARYGGIPGSTCTYKDWSDASYNRYLVEQK
jgi:isopenicillin N synthase-like dioxygenase